VKLGRAITGALVAGRLSQGTASRLRAMPKLGLAYGVA